MTFEKEETRGNFIFRHIGQNHIVVFPDARKLTNGCITMTGSAVKSYIDIPYFHRIVKIVILHMTSAYADGSYASTYTMYMEAGKSVLGLKYFKDFLFEDDDVITALATERFGEGFEYEPRTWTLELTSQNTDLVLPVLYIQYLGNEQK